MPERRSLAQLRDAVQGCRGCDLYKNATQAVFGEGTAREVMLVGEQPGDKEDLAGRPFVGPAGQLLDSQLAEHVTATIHPSAILRREDQESRQAELAAFVDDLRVVAALLRV